MTLLLQPLSASSPIHLTLGALCLLGLTFSIAYLSLLPPPLPLSPCLPLLSASHSDAFFQFFSILILPFSLAYSTPTPALVVSFLSWV